MNPENSRSFYNAQSSEVESNPGSVRSSNVGQAEQHPSTGNNSQYSNGVNSAGAIKKQYRYKSSADYVQGGGHRNNHRENNFNQNQRESEIFNGYRSSANYVQGGNRSNHRENNYHQINQESTLYNGISKNYAGSLSNDAFHQNQLHFEKQTGILYDDFSEGYTARGINMKASTRGRDKNYIRNVRTQYDRDSYKQGERRNGAYGRPGYSGESLDSYNYDYYNNSKSKHFPYGDMQKFNRDVPNVQSYSGAQSDYHGPQNYANEGYFHKNFVNYNKNIKPDKYYGKHNLRSKDHWKGNNGNAGRKMENNKARMEKLDAASQRERLEEMITRRTLECLVCCEIFKHNDKIWSCKQCYHILHLKCTRAWANSSKLENGWRCPACQNVCNEIPSHYKCYCGKTKDPRREPGLTPHSCGEVCQRKRRICEHNCVILCHPGPCPDCVSVVSKSCGCGQTRQQVKCSSDVEIICQGVCDKQLECGLHRCETKCHVGDCEPCAEILRQECYCGKVGRITACTGAQRGATLYSCEEVCDKVLTCENHKCKEICHPGRCAPCVNDINLINTCPCEKTTLTIKRTSCLDDVPACAKKCGKSLSCGQPNAPHKCQSSCHGGDCPPCVLTTVMKCRCGHMDKEVPCKNVTTKADDARCEKKCTKKRLCGKHRCNQRCCIEIEHFCPLPCNRNLTCGNHKCERTCHSGRCPSCVETSFDELHCECGASILFPPIHCGTKPPLCDKPCGRERSCGHQVNHACHTGPCPPCTVLSKRWCYGKHEQRAAIPCHQESFSCGLACGKELPCGKHGCVKLCHLGPCPTPCKQPCTIVRALCGHGCNVPCHMEPCPKTSCKKAVLVTCMCGHQKSSKPCNDLVEEYKNLEAALINEKMSNLIKDQTVDITDIAKLRRPEILKILECTEECRVLERNRRLAIGLQIRNPDISQKLTPRYSDLMRNWAKKDPHFCQRVHDKLTDLVQLAKQSKQKSRSYSFESMNRDKRHFIHEYCEHFGCESAAYDLEPNRNIVATATRDKSWLPGMSLLEIIQRENGQRKVPGPTLLGKNFINKSESVTLKLPGRNQKVNPSQGEVVDYFNNPPT